MVRFRPFPNVGIVQLRDEADRFMVECLGTHLPGSKAACPPVNVWEQEGEFLVEVDVPGYRNEEIEIGVMGSELTLKGLRTDPSAEGVNYLRRERTNNEFARTLRLPVDVDVDNVSATLENGVLRVILPKAVSMRPRKVEVKGASQQ
jgi:HSP20 family protein